MKKLIYLETRVKKDGTVGAYCKIKSVKFTLPNTVYPKEWDADLQNVITDGLLHDYWEEIYQEINSWRVAISEGSRMFSKDRIAKVFASKPFKSFNLTKTNIRVELDSQFYEFRKMVGMGKSRMISIKSGWNKFKKFWAEEHGDVMPIDMFASVAVLKEFRNYCVMSGLDNKTINLYVKDIANFAEYQLADNGFEVKLNKMLLKKLMMTANESTGRNRINWDRESIAKLFKSVKPKGLLEEYAWQSFRFRCLTGLRHSELETVKIVGTNVIEYDNVKKNRPVDGRIISAQAIEILKGLKDVKYNGGLKYGSYHNDRNNLKAMAGRARMNEEISQRKQNGKGTPARTVTTIAEKIATHDSRRIYATIMEDAGTSAKLIKVGLDHMNDDTEGYGGRQWNKLREAEITAFENYAYI